MKPVKKLVPVTTVEGSVVRTELVESPSVGASLRDQLAIRFMDQLMAPMYARGVSPRVTAQLARTYADNLIEVLKEDPHERADSN